MTTPDDEQDFDNLKREIIKRKLAAIHRLEAREDKIIAEIEALIDDEDDRRKNADKNYTTQSK